MTSSRASARSGSTATGSALTTPLFTRSRWVLRKRSSHAYDRWSTALAHADTTISVPRPAAAEGPRGSRTQPAWILGIRDLQWRKRRFAVAIVATGLVFGLALLMTGIQSS